MTSAALNVCIESLDVASATHDCHVNAILVRVQRVIFQSKIYVCYTLPPELVTWEKSYAQPKQIRHERAHVRASIRMMYTKADCDSATPPLLR